MARTSALGGENARRSLWGRRGGPILIAFAVAFIIGIVMVLAWQIIGLLLGGALFVVVWFATLQTDNNSPITRLVRRRHFRKRDALGLTSFVPFDPAVWPELVDAVGAATGKKARLAATKVMRAMRALPDGVDGMRWLEDGVGVPGIAWHRPAFEEEYLSVVFRLDGQVAGVESDAFLESCQAGFGRYLAQYGDRSALIKRVTLLTRMLPQSSSLHERWIEERRDRHPLDPARLAPGTPIDILERSYAQLVRIFRRRQHARHMVVAVIPVEGRFQQKVDRRGGDRDAWVSVVNDQIRSARASLLGAGFRSVTALTARQVAAVIRHMQAPDFPIDKVVDVTPSAAWLPSQEAWSYVTYYASPFGPSGPLRQSLSRTAMIQAKHMEAASLGALWLRPLLSGMHTQVVRTIAFHLELLPQDEARAAARIDYTSDQAELISSGKSGELADEEVERSVNAAGRRRNDLRPGTGHVGANWVGYVTVSAGTLTSLQDAVEAVEDVTRSMSIAALEWQDTMQAAAAACTWPVGRGLRPSKRSRMSQIQELAAGKTEKEAL